MTVANWIFERLAGRIEAGCRWLGERVSDRRVIPEPDGKPYLTRHYLVRRDRDDDVEVPKLTRATRLWDMNVYLHYFHRGDDDISLHNHPWRISFSLILTNGYMEERWSEAEQRIITRKLRPGSINIIRGNDFHRVTLLDPTRGVWTLFFAGPRTQSWGFWLPGVHDFIPWRRFIGSRSEHEYN